MNLFTGNKQDDPKSGALRLRAAVLQGTFEFAESPGVPQSADFYKEKRLGLPPPPKDCMGSAEKGWYLDPAAMSGVYMCERKGEAHS